jgi:hypothetical protein
MLRRIVWWKFTDVSDVFTASIIRALAQKTIIFILAAVIT